MKDLFIELINLMRRASKIKELSGKEKKKFVLNELRRIIPYDNAVEELLIDIVDLLIQVENGDIVINKKVKKSCMSMFRGCCYSDNIDNINEMF
jgi:hypothetical protein